MNGAEPLLQVSDLRCGYGRSDVIHGFSLDVFRGEIVCLIGPNGAGKSTLIKAIAGLVRPAAGRIAFAGRDITRTAVDERVEGGIALVPEGRGVLGNLSVEENLLLGGYVRRRSDDIAARLRQMTGLFPILATRRNQAASTLSGGEQQMLVIARALMSRPQLLILDEPSFGVAPLVVAAIFRTIVELRAAGTTVLLVEQNANMALRISERGYVIDSGRLVLTGSTEQLRGSSVVQEVYLGAAA